VGVGVLQHGMGGGGGGVDGGEGGGIDVTPQPREGPAHLPYQGGERERGGADEGRARERVRRTCHIRR
jgi:hypothetical protein